MRYVVSYDVTLPGLIEVEASSEDEAELIVSSMDPSRLLEQVNSDRDGIIVSIDGVSLGPNDP